MNIKICSVFSGGAIVTEKELTMLFESMKREGIKAVASNCERGFPMTALSAAEKAGLEIIVVMPCEEQADGWNEELRKKYFILHKNASMRFMISQHRTNDCYSKADRLLLTICGMALIAGNNPELEKIAADMGKRTVNIHAHDSVSIIMQH